MEASKADDETFVVHIIILLEPTTMPIHPFCQAQVALLMSKETWICAEYSDFSNIFSSDFAVELSEYTRFDDHPINLIDNNQLLYKSIYRLGLVELEILKTYIKANLANSLIKSFKFPTGALILFVWKETGSHRLYIGYWELNNLTIKNSYLPLLIGELLNCLGFANRFTQMDLTNTYHQITIRKSDKSKIAF